MQVQQAVGSDEAFPEGNGAGHQGSRGNVIRVGSCIVVSVRQPGTLHVGGQGIPVAQTFVIVGR